MKVHSIISFFALYLVSGLNAQVQEDQSYYQGFESSNLSPSQASGSVDAPNSQPTQVQQPSNEDPKKKVTQENTNKQQSQKQNKAVEKPNDKPAGNNPTQTRAQPAKPTTASQNPSTNSKQQAQPTSPTKPQDTQNPNSQPQGGKNKPTKASGSTGSCRKIRATPKMNITKVLQLVNKARGTAPSLKLDSALVKASVLQAAANGNKKSNKKSPTSNTQAEKVPISPSKECGYTGKSVIQYTTVAKNEDDLIKKFMTAKINVENLKNPKYKAFGAAKVGTQWTLTFGEL